MSMLVIMMWIGGIPAAYSLNRHEGLSRLSSGLEAFAWPFGLGYGLCLNFYVNSDWDKE